MAAGATVTLPGLLFWQPPVALGAVADGRSSGRWSPAAGQGCWLWAVDTDPFMREGLLKAHWLKQWTPQ